MDDEMDDDSLSRLRYSLKSCEKFFRDACGNPRYWEQAFLSSDGLQGELPKLPADERALWETRLNEWLPLMKDGANRAVGERILRRINDSLVSATERLAQDSDPSHDLERLERELAHPDTIECVPEAERKRAAQRLEALQAELARKAAEHQCAVATARLTSAEETLIELEATLQQHGGGANAYLARVVAGTLANAQAEVERLAATDAAHEALTALTAKLQQLRRRFDSL